MKIGTAFTCNKKILSLSVFLVLCFLLATVFFTYYRYLLPATVENNQGNFEMIQNRAGLVLNADTKILVATDGEPRDGTKGFFFWVFFSENYASILEKGSLMQYEARLNDNVDALEKKISPFKIETPLNAVQQNWTYKNTDVRMTTIAGKRGKYSMLETFKR